MAPPKKVARRTGQAADRSRQGHARAPPPVPCRYWARAQGQHHGVLASSSTRARRTRRRPDLMVPVCHHGLQPTAASPSSPRRRRRPVLLKKAAGIAKRSAHTRTRRSVGKVTEKRRCARSPRRRCSTRTPPRIDDGRSKSIKGTARSMGIEAGRYGSASPGCLSVLCYGHFSGWSFVQEPLDTDISLRPGCLQWRRRVREGLPRESSTAARSDVLFETLQLGKCPGMGTIQGFCDE